MLVAASRNDEVLFCDDKLLLGGSNKTGEGRL